MHAPTDPPTLGPLPAVQFIRLAPAGERPLAALFERIARDPDAVHFHPHPFDAGTARRIAGHAGRDQYFAIEVDGDYRAYGMLRGWDEGFAVPSLGIYLEASLRGTGASTAFMRFLHLSARLAGAPRVRLKVYPDNEPALRLYRSLGYRFDDPPADDGQRIGILALR